MFRHFLGSKYKADDPGYVVCDQAAAYPAGLKRVGGDMALIKPVSCEVNQHISLDCHILFFVHRSWNSRIVIVNTKFVIYDPVNFRNFQYQVRWKNVAVGSRSQNLIYVMYVILTGAFEAEPEIARWQNIGSP